jgi:hypothetical protein
VSLASAAPSQVQPTMASLGHPPALTPPAVPPASTGTDIKSFVAAKAPKSDVQFATTVAYYYRFEAPPAQRREAIDGDALQEAARLAGRARLSNPRQTLNNAKGLGYLDSNVPGEFVVNSVGENLVAMTLPGSGETGNSRPRVRRAPKKQGRAGRKG